MNSFQKTKIKNDAHLESSPHHFTLNVYLSRLHQALLFLAFSISSNLLKNTPFRRFLRFFTLLSSKSIYWGHTSTNTEPPHIARECSLRSLSKRIVVICSAKHGKECRKSSDCVLKKYILASANHFSCKKSNSFLSVGFRVRATRNRKIKSGNYSGF